MVGKFYAIKDERSIQKGTIISTLFAAVVAGGCYFLGGFGRLFTPDTTGEGAVIFDSIIPNMLKGLPDILIGIVVILVLSASMSTLSSLVLTSSSTLTLDLIKGSVVKKMKEKSQMLTMRIFIVFFVAVSAVIAILQYKYNISAIAQLMGVSWGALAGAFLAPYLYSLYWKRTTKAATWVCFAFGVGVMLANMLFKSAFPVWLQSPINCGALVMLAGLVIVPLVSLVTPKPNKEFLDDTFACYDREVKASAKEHLD